MPANYNNSACFYDRLSRVVYGKTLINAQVYLLQFIPPDANILIVGGGTGWILEEIAKIHASGLTITYVEIAPQMIALSKKRNLGNNQVNFVNDAIENVNLSPDFDVVITPFLFDNFVDETVGKVFNHIHIKLKKNGMWLNCDFQLTGKWWQWILLKSMFLFFRIICGIEASKLPAVKRQFDQAGYNLISQKTFFGDFVISEVFVKAQ